ncbi:MAG: hypothetical protein ABI895_19545 [Deltaproteobacteria bacterium]
MSLISSLSSKLLDKFDLADPEQFFALKNLLGITVSGLPGDASLPTDPGELRSFRIAQECLFQLRKGGPRPRLTPDGIIWKGRPAFMTDGLLQSLQEEMEVERPAAIIQRWGQLVSAGGPIAQGLAQSPETRRFVEELVGPVAKVGIASCLFYDSPGASIKPHVDTDVFSVNANFMIRHGGSGATTSQLWTYPVGGQPHPIPLEPGEMVLMYADCVVHARTPLSAGETVRTITVGFQPCQEVHQ